VRVDSAASLPVPATITADPDDTVVGIDFSAGPAAVAAAIQSTLGPGYTVSNPSGNILRVLDDGAGGTTDVAGLSAEVTTTALTGQGLGLPMFVDGGNGTATKVFTGAYDGHSQATGFAARITVNPALRADASRLVVYATAPATMAGDPARPADLMRRLRTAARDLSGDPADPSGPGFHGTVGAFTRRVLDIQAARASTAQSLDDGQQVVVTSLRERFSEVSGVSVDQELAQLVALQNAYAANARIVTAVRDMFDALMRI
jgi:flagellar hook-associated protein 1 FlgK